MLEGWEKIAQVLDKDQPTWWKDWASQDDLRDLALRPSDVDRGAYETAINRIRYRVAGRLFHPILSAGVAAGLVEVALPAPTVFEVK